MKYLKYLFAVGTIGFLVSIYVNLTALPDGYINVTKKNGETFGCGCHNLDPSDSTKVFILGPSVVEAQDTVEFRVKITKAGVLAGGTDIATQFGSVITSPLDTFLSRRTNSPDTTIQSDYELTHKHPKLDVNDTVSFIFRYVAPATIGMIDTIFANGNAVNLDTLSIGDNWNYAENKLVTVIPSVSVENNNTIVKDFRLEQNYPNPFNPVTKISFNIYKGANVTLSLFDISGKEVAKLIDNKFYNAGTASYTLDAAKLNLNSGLYFYKLEANGVSDIKKMVLVK